MQHPVHIMVRLVLAGRGDTDLWMLSGTAHHTMVVANLVEWDVGLSPFAVDPELFDFGGGLP